MSKYLPSDQLLCHQLLLIGDITSADIVNDQPLTLKTKHNLLFQKVKLVGLAVSVKHHHTDNSGRKIRCLLHIDDGTATIPVYLTERIYHREGMSRLKTGAWVTIIGEVQKLDDSFIIACKGYLIEVTPMVEIAHWLQVLVNHKNITSSLDHSAVPARKRQKRSESNLFVSLSSQPSPIRASVEDLYPSSPIISDENGIVSSSQIIREAPWHWSPDHIAATSTPLMQCLFGSPNRSRALNSVRSSPLRITETINETPAPEPSDTGMDDDDFGFADDSELGALDFDDLEKKALEHRIA